MTVTGSLLSLFAVVHTVWTGFHAPLAVWMAPLAVGLLVGGIWSLVTGRRLPRWATVLLVLAGVVLVGLLLWMLVLIVFVLKNTLV